MWLIQVMNIGTDKNRQLILPPQSVILLTIPKQAVTPKTIVVKDDATVAGGKNATKIMDYKKITFVPVRETRQLGEKDIK